MLPAGSTAGASPAEGCVTLYLARGPSVAGGHVVFTLSGYYRGFKPGIRSSNEVHNRND
jgi:hypothetical protein